MKWSFVIQQKLKVASLLLGVMVLIIIFNIIEQRNIAAINRSVASIYNDRLIPAADIFYLSDNLYNKRFIMEKFLVNPNTEISDLKLSLEKHNTDINSLIKHFEKTYLVHDESSSLKEFKNQVNKYALIEKRILDLSSLNKKEEAFQLYESQGKTSLISTISKLSELTKIQTEVGGELLNNSKGILAKSDLLSNIQLVLAIVIGIMVVSLVSASKMAGSTERNFNLN